MIVWIDFTEKEQLIRLWFPLNQETENYISYNDLWSEIFLNLPDQMNADVESLQELLSVELVITKSISSFLKGSMIPPKVWDDKDPQYLFNVIPEEIWTSEAKAYFAAQCGLYDGSVNEVKGIADFVTLVCEVIVDKKKRYKTSKMIGDLELLAVWDGVCSLTSKHFETLIKLDCRAAHLAGKDVAAIISAFIPITKVGTAAKSGKFFSEMASLTAKEMKKTVLAVKNFPKTVVLKTKDLTKGIVDLFYGSKRIGEIRSGVLYPAKIADAHIIDGKFDRLSKEVIDQNGDPLVLTKSLDGEHHFCHTDGSCFIAGTFIKTDQGEKAIEAIKIGDQVWSYNESKGSEELKEVTRVKKRFTNEIIKIQAGVEEITTTPEHPFYIEGRWVSAEELKVGDWLWLFDQRKIAIEHLAKLDSNATVYNFTVKGNSNYYVGEEGVLVHNEYIKVDVSSVLASLPAPFRTKINAIKDPATKNTLLKQLGDDSWKKQFVDEGEGMVDAWEVVVESIPNKTLTVFATDIETLKQLSKMIQPSSTLRKKYPDSWQSVLTDIVFTSRKNPCLTCSSPNGLAKGRSNMHDHLAAVEYFILNFERDGVANKFFAWMRGKKIDGVEMSNEGNLSEMFQTIYELNRRQLNESRVSRMGGGFLSGKTSKKSDITVGSIEIELKNKDFSSKVELDKSDVEQVFGATGAFAALSRISDYIWVAFEGRSGGLSKLKSLWQKAFTNADPAKGMLTKEIFEVLWSNQNLRRDIFENGISKQDARLDFDDMIRDQESTIFSFINSQ